MRRPCIECGALISSGSRCPKHTYRNGSTRNWRKRRAEVLLRDGHACQWPGCKERATHVDHILAAVNSGSDDYQNLQSLCQRHNQLKGAS